MRKNIDFNCYWLMNEFNHNYSLLQSYKSSFTRSNPYSLLKLIKVYLSNKKIGKAIILLSFLAFVHDTLKSQSLCYTMEMSSSTPGEPPSSVPCDDVSGPFFIRIYPHIIRNSNHSGGQPESAVRAAIDNLNGYFNIHNIFFVAECGILYIDEDDYYQNAIFANCQFYETYGHEDGIDIYFDDEDANLEGGIALDIGSTAFVLGGLWTENQPDISVAQSSLIAHEMGHCLNLYHTHHMIEGAFNNPCTGVMHPPGEIENMQNCETKGDKCCDTPPDPNLSFNVNSNCVWTEDDGINDPDVSLIMSYTSPHCAWKFSACQAKKMRCYIYHELQQCLLDFETSFQITENTEWTPATVPHNGDFIIFNNLTVKSGTILTVGAGVTLKFGKNAKLIIEPNATLHLYGTLTSWGCNWKGVEVYGNSDFNQYYDFVAQTHHQGLFKSYQGSKIENAETAIQLWGPNEEDTGGKISCIGTEFLNNRIGVFFLPYENKVAGQPKSYIASFSDCKFSINGNLPFPSFDEHALLSGVDGIRFSGCNFECVGLPNQATSQSSYGYGIASINAGFSVTALSEEPNEPFPCLPGNCEIIKKSKFTGLGFGIYNSSYGSNRLFRVYQASFENCYTGIEVDGVSGGVILFNNFKLGSVQNTSVMDGNQVGIKLTQSMAGFTIEQDTFEKFSGNANNTIGISAENIGDMNNAIRKNKFIGVSLANEAFGANASEDEKLDGLRYICNDNTNVTDKDFYVKNSSQYFTDNISPLQADVFEGAEPIATGNKFSSTGNTSNGDFANYGNPIELYLFGANNTLENPDQFEGILFDQQGDPNSCVGTFCAPPCLSQLQLNSVKSNYYNNRVDYYEALAANEVKEAAIIKSKMDYATKIIVQHMLLDTSTFNRDSLRIWYSNSLSLSGDLLLAKDYAVEGNYTMAFQILSSLAGRYELNSEQENDINEIDTIFELLSEQKVSSLTPNDINLLLSFTDNPGHSSSMSRSILAYHGYRHETNYVLPDSGGLGMVKMPSTLDNDSGLKLKDQLLELETRIEKLDDIKLFPNPTNGNNLNIIIPSLTSYDLIQLDIWTLTGSKIMSKNLMNGKNTIEIPVGINSPLAYRVIGDGRILKTGRLLIFK